MVGAPRFRGFAGLSIGSVAGQVMAQAHCPVLVIRRSKAGPMPTSDAGPVLVDVAGSVAADLLVVGSRGRGPVTGAVLGSVSQVLISHAEAPVAVIGPPAGPSVGLGLGLQRSAPP